MPFSTFWFWITVWQSSLNGLSELVCWLTKQRISNRYFKMFMKKGLHSWPGPNALKSVCRKPQSPSFFLSNAIVETVRIRINAVFFIFFKADVRSLKSESLSDVSVTRIGDTLSNDFPQTEIINELELWTHFAWKNQKICWNQRKVRINELQIIGRILLRVNSKCSWDQKLYSNKWKFELSSIRSKGCLL